MTAFRTRRVSRLSAWLAAGFLAWGLAPAATGTAWAQRYGLPDEFSSELPNTIRGQVTRANGSSVTLITDEGARRTIQVGDDSHITLNGRPADLSDLNPGDIVSIRTQSDDRREAQRITATRQRRPGGLAARQGSLLGEWTSAFRQGQSPSGSSGPASLGIGMDIRPLGQPGVRVQEIIANSPADRAGLRQGDYITHIGSDQIQDPSHLIFALRRHKAGESVQITIYRNGQQQALTAQLAARVPVIHDDDVLFGHPEAAQAPTGYQEQVGYGPPGRFAQPGAYGPSGYPGAQAPRGQQGYFEPQGFQGNQGQPQGYPAGQPYQRQQGSAWQPNYYGQPGYAPTAPQGSSQPGTSQYYYRGGQPGSSEYDEGRYE